MDGLVTGLAVALTGGLITLVAWLSPRATKKGRLLMELRRLGDARANLPATAELERLDKHIDERIRALNDWLDPINRRGRRLQSGVSWVSATVGTGLVLAVQPHLEDPSARSAAVVAILAAVIFGGAAGMIGIERWELGSARKRQEKEDREHGRQRAASRLGVEDPR